MNEFKSQKIKSCLKDLLKKKNITYEDLAQELECSVPTIKRILGTEEITLNRLLHLCEIVEVDLAELEMLVQGNEIKQEKFTDSQDLFLSKNTNFFAYLVKLFDGKTPKEIAEQYKLSDKSTTKYLIGLEKHDLIRVTGKQRVKPAFKRGPTIGNGHLAKVYFQSFISKTSSFFTEIVNEGLRRPKNEVPKSKGIFGLQTVRITQATYEKWVKDHERLLMELDKIASFEEKIKDPSELQHCVIINAHALVPEQHIGLKALDNALGDITNF